MLQNAYRPPRLGDAPRRVPPIRDLKWEASLRPAEDVSPAPKQMVLGPEPSPSGFPIKVVDDQVVKAPAKPITISARALALVGDPLPQGCQVWVNRARLADGNGWNRFG